MKLDWDLAREVLTDIEEMSVSDRNEMAFTVGDEEDSPAATKARHAFLLFDAGFVRGIRSDTLEADRLMRPDLTWEGHQLLATIRSKDVWDRVKRMAKEKGLSLSIDLVKIGGKLALEHILKGGSSDPGLSA